VISRTTKSFWKRYDTLPADVQRQAVRAWNLWRDRPFHSGLQFKCVSDEHAVWSIRIGVRWRALSYRATANGNDIVTWFWIGSHAQYDQLVKEL